jgi:hypothetical protein
MVLHRVRRWKIQFVGTKEQITEVFFQLPNIASYAKGHWKKTEDDTIWQCVAGVYFSDQYRITALKKMLKEAVRDMQPILKEKDFLDCLELLEQEDNSTQEPLLFGKFVSANEQRGIQRRAAWDQAKNKNAKIVFSIIQQIHNRGIIPASKYIYDNEPDKVFLLETAVTTHHKMVETDMQHKLMEDAKLTKWNPWQSYLFDLLEKKPDPRQIIVVVDPVGNTGKTFFVQHYRRLHPETTVALNNSRRADMLYSAQQCVERQVVMVDLMRSEKKNIAYDAIELLKNGCFVNSKYQSRMVEGNPPHVVLFTNFELNYKALSEDRWFIIDLQKQENSQIINWKVSRIQNGEKKMAL